MTKQQFGEAYKLTPRTVSQLIKEGLPMEQGRVKEAAHGWMREKYGKGEWKPAKSLLG